MIKVSLFSELFVDPNFLLKTIILRNSTGTNMDIYGECLTIFKGTVA